MAKQIVETIEEIKEELVKVKFLGNFKEFMSGEEYELRAEEAAPYITLGYAKEVK
jgi:hypothetical protein